MKRRDSWCTEEWIHELDNVISMGRGWLGGLPPRSEGEIPSANAAKQLAEEACEFASCISVLSISITKCPRMRTCGHCWTGHYTPHGSSKNLRIRSTGRIGSRPSFTGLRAVL